MAEPQDEDEDRRLDEFTGGLLIGPNEAFLLGEVPPALEALADQINATMRDRARADPAWERLHDWVKWRQGDDD